MVTSPSFTYLQTASLKTIYGRASIQTVQNHKGVMVGGRYWAV